MESADRDFRLAILIQELDYGVNGYPSALKFIPAK